MSPEHLLKEYSETALPTNISYADFEASFLSWSGVKSNGKKLQNYEQHLKANHQQEPKQQNSMRRKTKSGLIIEANVQEATQFVQQQKEEATLSATIAVAAPSNGNHHKNRNNSNKSNQQQQQHQKKRNGRGKQKLHRNGKISYSIIHSHSFT